MQIRDIGWSRYRDFEGPFTLGTERYELPDDPTDDDRIMAVITATEGGRWNAVNMYDTCILTVGLIQFCERYYLVSDMLGKLAVDDLELIAPMNPVLQASGAHFVPNHRKRWRFFFKDDRGEVDRPDEQKQLFLLHSSGKRGSWDPASTDHAKYWALAMVNIFQEPRAVEIQKAFTVGMMRKFATKSAKLVLDRAPDNELGKAFIASYLSYAANNPTWASNNLARARETATADEFSLDWLVHVLRVLTYGPKVHIYPHRYDAIRPVIERLYGIDLPDTSDILQRELKEYMPVREIQTVLAALGYDLGPYGDNGDGVDGVYKFGGKTYQAIADFQRAHHIVPDDEDKFGWVGDDTALALRTAHQAMIDEGAKVKQRHEDGTIDEYTRRRVMAVANMAVAQALDNYFKTAHDFVEQDFT